MPDIRTTMEPDKVLVVGDREAYDLGQQGLLVDDKAAPEQDPAAGLDGHPDADKHHDEVQAQRREELDPDEPKSRRGTGKAKDTERS